MNKSMPEEIDCTGSEIFLVMSVLANTGIFTMHKLDLCKCLDIISLSILGLYLFSKYFVNIQ